MRKLSSTVKNVLQASFLTQDSPLVPSARKVKEAATLARVAKKITSIKFVSIHQTTNPVSFIRIVSKRNTNVENKATP